MAVAALLELPARLTMGNARAGLENLRRAEAALPTTGPLVIDASPLAELDTSALAVLLELRRDADGAGRGFELQGPPTKLAQLARLYGVDELLGLVAAAADAAAHAGA